MAAFKYPYVLFLLAGLLAFIQGAPVAITGTIKLDHFGYRVSDPKIAYFTADPGGRVEVRRSGDDSPAYTVGAADIVDKGMDRGSPLISGDHVWWVDFSGLAEGGRFYLYSPFLNERSYDFSVDDGIYQSPMEATLKALYLQRCGTPKPAQYAGVWSDENACHLQDRTTRPACAGSPYGNQDLSGGWHDAGDYNKYIGNSNRNCGSNWSGDSGSSVWYLLSAYELNPGAFYDGQSQIPESGNGVPDILDEVKWYLDWYLKMQMNDRHVLSVVHQTNYTGGAPPSADATTRYYYIPNGTAEAIFVASLAHAARVLGAFPLYAVYAEALKTAALGTWNAWVRNASSSDYKFWAAAELFRLDPTQTDAQSFVDRYKNWPSLSMNVNQFHLNYGIYTYAQTPAATPAVVSAMKGAVGRQVDTVFRANDHYNSGMASYDYFWSSNQVKAEYAMALIWGVTLEATGSHTAAECLNHAQDYLHYLNGANPLNMVYMSNTDAMGAKHSLWRLYHGWFGSYGDTRYSRPNFIGKPAAVDDPLYPYFDGVDNFGIRDDDASLYGPPPGFVVDGPTYQYKQLGGQAQPPNQPDGSGAPYAKAYRDWNYSDPTGSRTMPWIVNETGIYYISSYTFLSSQFVSPKRFINRANSIARGALGWPLRKRAPF